MITQSDMDVGALYMKHLDQFDTLIFPDSRMRIVSARGQSPIGSSVGFDDHQDPKKDCYVIYPESITEWHRTVKKNWERQILRPLEKKYTGRAKPLLPQFQMFIAVSGHEVRHRAQAYLKPSMYTLADLRTHPTLGPVREALDRILMNRGISPRDKALEVDARICEYILTAMLILGTADNRGFRWAITRGPEAFLEIEREYGLAF